MQRVEIYGRNFCPFVQELRGHCLLFNLPFVVRDTWMNPAVEAEMASRNPPSCATPQVFVGDRTIGSLNDFLAALEDGSLHQIIGGR